MAAEDRPADYSLMHNLLAEGYTFSFFQAVRLLEQYCADAARVGYQGPAKDEAVRFRPLVSLCFPCSDMAAVEQIDSDGYYPRFRLTVTFLGLYGAVSPLPTFYTEEILWKDFDQTSVRDFLDIFHHRLISLFYRCWSKYRYYIQFKAGGSDEFSQRMLALIGLRTPALADEVGVTAIRLVRYAGLITQLPRSASGLVGVLSDYFGGLAVQVQQCMGRWVAVPEEQRNVLGERNNELGVSLVIGRRVYDRSGKFRIRVGPVGFASFIRFLPIGDDFHDLVKIAEFYSLDRLDFDVEVSLWCDEIPELRLSSEEPALLGWTSWLGRPRGAYTSVVFQKKRPPLVVTPYPSVEDLWPPERLAPLAVPVDINEYDYRHEVSAYNSRMR